MHKTFRIPFIGIQIEKRKQLPKRNTKEPKRPLPPLLLPALDFAGALVLAEGPFQPPVAVAVPLDDERSIPALGTTKPVEVKSAPAGPTAVTLPRRGGYGRVRLYENARAPEVWAVARAVVVEGPVRKELLLPQGRGCMIVATPGMPDTPGLISSIFGSAVDVRSASAIAICLLSRS